MKKILLIEDNIDMRENIAEILELANFEVLTAENGKKGVELAKKELPNLIICDIMMPKLDGYGVIHILSRNPDTAGIPFIFLTAKSDKSDIRKGMNLGADDYLTKPFEEMELLDAIESRLKRSKNIRQEFEQGLNGFSSFINEAKAIDELKNLSADRKIKRFKKKETIYREGEFSNFLYLINKGRVKLTKTDDYGKDLVMDIKTKGNFIGYMALLEGPNHIETATTLEETELALIPKDEFQYLLKKNRDVAHRFIKMLANNVKANEERLLRIAYGSVRERVADTLLKLQAKQNAPGQTEGSILISREDLAGIVGTAKESLIRTLSEFKQDNLIESIGKEIIIKNKEGLKQLIY
jgi:CRP-like cAMP-binding protein